MKRDRLANIGYYTMVATCLSFTIFTVLEEQNMDIILEIIKYAAAAVVGIIITQIINRKTEIKTLCRQLGLNDDKTLRTELMEQYSDIMNNIGRGDRGTLTNQHQEMRKEILSSYSEIKGKYQAEEDAYKKFTYEQHDLKLTLDNFSRDYMERINNEQELSRQNEELLNKNKEFQKVNEKLQEENEELKAENRTLQNELHKLRERDNPGRGR